MIASFFLIFYQLWFWRRRFAPNVKAIGYEETADGIESSVDQCAQRLTIKVDENSTELIINSQDGALRDQFASPESGIFSPGNSLTTSSIVDGSDGAASGLITTTTTSSSTSTAAAAAAATTTEFRNDSLGGVPQSEDDESLRDVVDRFYSPVGSSAQQSSAADVDCVFENTSKSSRERSSNSCAGDDDQECERKVLMGELHSSVRDEERERSQGRRPSELESSLLETKDENSANCEHEGGADETRVAMQSFGLQFKQRRGETKGHRQDGGETGVTVLMTEDGQQQEMGVDEDADSTMHRGGVENGEVRVETDNKSVDEIAEVDLMDMQGDDSILTKLQQSSSGDAFQEQYDQQHEMGVCIDEEANSAMYRCGVENGEFLEESKNKSENEIAEVDLHGEAGEDLVLTKLQQNSSAEFQEKDDVRDFLHASCVAVDAEQEEKDLSFIWTQEEFEPTSPLPSAPPGSAEETDEEPTVDQSAGSRDFHAIDGTPSGRSEIADAEVHQEAVENELSTIHDNCKDHEVQDKDRKLVIKDGENQVSSWSQFEQGLLTPIADQVASMIGALNADYDCSELSFGRSQSTESQRDLDDVELEKLPEQCDGNEDLAAGLKEMQVVVEDGKVEAVHGKTAEETIYIEMQGKTTGDHDDFESRGETREEEYGVETDELGESTPTPGNLDEFNFSRFSSEVTPKKNGLAETDESDGVVGAVLNSGESESKQTDEEDEINDAEVEQGGKVQRTSVGRHEVDASGTWNLEDVRKQSGEELGTKNAENCENYEEEEHWSVMANRDDEEARSIQDFEEEPSDVGDSAADSDLEVTVPAEMSDWYESMNEMTPRVAEQSADTEFEYTPTESRTASAAAAAAFDVDEAEPDVKVDLSQDIDEPTKAESTMSTERSSEFQSSGSTIEIRIDLTDGQELENLLAAEAGQKKLQDVSNQQPNADNTIPVLISHAENSEIQPANVAEDGQVNRSEASKPPVKSRCDLLNLVITNQQNGEGTGDESARSPRSPRSPRLFDRPARPLLMSNVVEYTNKAFEKTAIHRSVSSDRGRYLERVLEDNAELETGLEESIARESRQMYETKVEVALGHNGSELEIVADKQRGTGDEGKENLYSTDMNEVGYGNLETGRDEVNAGGISTEDAERLLAAEQSIEENQCSEVAEMPEFVGSDLENQSDAIGVQQVSGTLAPEIDASVGRSEETATTQQVLTEINSIESVDDLVQQFSALRFDGKRDGVATGRAGAQNVDTLALQLSGLDLERGQNENANKLVRQFSDLKLIENGAVEGSDENLEKLEIPLEKVEKASIATESSRLDFPDAESVPTAAAVKFEDASLSFVADLVEKPPPAVEKLDEEIEETGRGRISGERLNVKQSSETFRLTQQLDHRSPLPEKYADDESLPQASTPQQSSPGERHISKATMELKPAGSSTKKTSGLPTLAGTGRPVDDNKFSLVRIRRQLPTTRSEDAAEVSSSSAAAAATRGEFTERNVRKSTTETTPFKAPSPSASSSSSASWLSASASTASAAVGTTTMTSTVRTIKSPKDYRMSSKLGSASLQEDPRDLRESSALGAGRSTERTSLTFSPDTEVRSLTIRHRPKHRLRPEMGRLPVRATDLFGADEFGADFDAVDDEIFSAEKPDKETLHRVYRGRSKSEHMDNARLSLKLDNPLAELKDLTLPNVRRMTELFAMQQRPPPSSKIPRRPYISRTPPPSAYTRRHYDESEFSLIDQNFSPDAKLSIVRQNRKTSSGGSSSGDTTPRRPSSAFGFNLKTC